ncbi:RNA polymerase sigma factor [Botrimarina hoheduenensis]|uniref:RNA polymerase factor sigma-70 n=1 Tax=Botrimarina hoheduenensis TaxID=2528000 RepID=A0A5C5VZD1_9BACT|nr:sigma-70 family RNA polymerase sigma factor [Botrimarina hoheduenensis]TWT43457.1 RNA polymerase factor sigma-70 [Botrimarina hoheduenensis]
MPDDPPDDEDLAIRMMDKDEYALGEVMKRYGPKVFGYLKKQFKDSLGTHELEEALNASALSLWNYADKYDPEVARLSTVWISFAHNAAIDLIRAKPKLETQVLDESCEGIEDPDCESDDSPLLDHIHDFIFNQLTGFERVVGINFFITDEANAKRLAEQNGKTINTVNVTKHKVKEKIAQEVRAFRTSTTTRKVRK